MSDDGHATLHESCDPTTDILGTAVEPLSEEESEADDWQRLAAHSLSAAYGDDEPEYSPDLIKEPNPEYRKR